MAERLEKDVEYGALPFDYYVVDHWPEELKDSPQQWETLVWKYQELSLIDRHSYYCRAQDVLGGINSPEFTEEQIRTLSIHQSINERNACGGEEGALQTVWLRTCYDEDLDEKYEDMRDEAEMGRDRYLEDGTRYAFDNGTPDHWRPVLLRVPGVTDMRGIMRNGDHLIYLSCKNQYEFRAECEAIEDEKDRALSLAQLEFQVVLYLLDREAIESGLIKVLWLNEHGYSVWENRVEPTNVEVLATAFLNSYDLEEIQGGNDGRGSLLSN